MSGHQWFYATLFFTNFGKRYYVNSMKKSVSKITLENGCCFDFSILKQFDKDMTTEAISIKYVVKGSETYQVGCFSRPLTEKHFLLLDNKESVRAFVDSRSDVKVQIF